MAKLKRRYVLIDLVGEKGGVAVAVGIEDLELGAGMGALAAAEKPGCLGPGGEVEQIGELGYRSALARGALGVDRRLPRRFGQREDRLADPLVELMAD